MRRFGAWVIAAALTASAGCDSGGIKEGMETDPNKEAPGGQPPSFVNQMKAQGEKMQNQKKRPANTPKAPVAAPDDAGKTGGDAAAK